MSEENVEVIRQALEVINRRDTEAALRYIDPEVEASTAIISGAEGNIYRGHEGFREWMAESAATFEEIRMQPEEFRDLGDDVLLIGRIYARGRESGVEIDSATAWLFTLRGSRIVRVRGYLNPQEALEAAGLSE
jgi:ketosteroid isomerase-like protein